MFRRNWTLTILTLVLVPSLWSRNTFSDAFLSVPPLIPRVSGTRLATPHWTRVKRICRNEQKDERSSEQEIWEAGNVYEDLAQLEQAIIEADEGPNKEHDKRVELLQHFADSRRPLFPDVGRFLLGPLSCALMLRLLAHNPKSRLAVSILWRAMDIHFWALVVASPLLLLTSRRRGSGDVGKPNEQDLPLQLGAWSTPVTAYTDHVGFVLQYWSSAVWGMALVGAVQGLSNFFPRILPQMSAFGLWWVTAQFLTRMAALSSVYQFPNQVFELRRSDERRFASLATRAFIRNMFLAAPVALASDLSKLFMHFNVKSLGALYAGVAVVAVDTWLRLRRKQVSLEFEKLERWSWKRKLVMVLALSFYWRKPLISLGLSMATTSIEQVAQQATLGVVTRMAVCVVPILCPLIHLNAISKLFRTIYTDDLSLAMDVDDFEECMEDEALMKERTMWRYRLEWREDRDLGVLLKEWSWFFWFFTRGSVVERMRLESRDTKRRSEMDDQILDFLGDSLVQQLGNAPIRDREKWKEQAMERVAKKHQADYDSGNYEDPLGVAVQQTLGIGLGFNFDHNSPLEDGEKPSVRRLQARAAKSAIRRVQELYNPEVAKEALEGVTDPEENAKIAKDIRQRADDEVKHLAQRLTDLVPTWAADEPQEDIEVEMFGHSEASPDDMYDLDEPFGDRSTAEERFDGFRSVHAIDIDSPGPVSSNDDIPEEVV